MSFSNYLENKILDHTFLGSVFVAPVSIYVGLFNGNPGETGVNEVTAVDYERVFNNSWSLASNGITKNTVEVAFVEASTSWGVVSHIGLFDDISAGNYLVGGVLAVSQLVSVGATVKFEADKISISLD